jgi:hypothetical protein
MRYSHVCLFSCLGAVKLVPDSFSAYNPDGGFCGLLCPTGNAPGTLSDLLPLAHYKDETGWW